ncbi:AsmA family protein [Taibaiella soli]|uniref:Uncharacterized protein n=1 Tax=Taibaiella soli TaxID=1649169 RepID=A0A2W2B6G1_9BACT|nr:hypothetical protein [Taibaiella soli]PZF71799.1 hypothetical protein DN068_17185 [Taibaiella soli]
MVRHKKLKIGGIVFVCFLLGVHLFVKWKAGHILSSIVSNITNNKYRLKTSAVRIHYTTIGILAKNVVLEPVDSAERNNAVHFTADEVLLDLHGLRSLFADRALNIDEVRLVNPTIIIPPPKDVPAVKDTSDIVIHDQLLSIQNTVNNMVNSLRMTRFRIDNAQIKIYTDQQNHFFSVDRVSLHVDHLFADVKANQLAKKIKLNADIHLWLDHPHIVYPDSAVAITIDQFDWNSATHKFVIENIAFSKRKNTPGGDSSHINLHEVSITRLNWSKWANAGEIVIDTVKANSGDVYIETIAKSGKKGKQSNDIANRSILNLLSPMSIQYLSIRKINSSAQTTSDNLALAGKIDGDSLEVTGFNLDATRKAPVQLKSLKLDIKQFKGKDLGDTWETSFAVFRIDQDSIVLKDYTLQSTAESHFGNRNLFRIPRLVLTDFSLSELVAGRLKADEMRMENPYFQLQPGLLTIPKGRQKAVLKPRTLKERFPYLSVRSFILSNGTLVIFDKHSANKIVQANGINGSVDITQLMQANGVAEYITSGKMVDIENVQLNLPQAQVLTTGMKIDPDAHTVFLNTVNATLANKAGKVGMTGVLLQIDSLNRIIHERNNYSLKELSVVTVSADVALDKLPKAKKKTTPGESPFWMIRQVNVGAGNIRAKKGAMTSSLVLDKIAIVGLSNAGGTIGWDDISVASHKLAFANKDMVASADQVVLRSNDVTQLQNFRFYMNGKGKNITAEVPVIQMQIPLHALPQKDFDMELASAHFLNPSFQYASANDTSHFHIGGSGDHLNFSGLKLHQEQGQKLKWNAAEIDVKTNGVSFQKDDHTTAHYEAFSATLTDVDARSPGRPLSFNVKDFLLQGVTYSRKVNDKEASLKLNDVTIVNTGRVVATKDSLLRLLYGNAGILMNGADIILDNPLQTIRFYNVSVDIAHKSFTVDSFTMRNKMSRDSIFAMQPVEKDVFTVSSGRISAGGVSTVRYMSDTGFAIHNMNIDSLKLKVERDKRRPDDTVSYRPLLAKMLERIPFLISVDTIVLKNSLIWHNVIEEKRGQEGTIYFTDVNGWVADVRNYNMNNEDTLRIRVRAKLMGKGNMNMRFRQSYADSLQTFLLYANMGKYKMAGLNQILEPLTRIKIDEGTIDSIWLRVKANDLVAFGSMEMDYRELRVALVNKRHERQGFLSWVANKVIHKKNYKRGKVYVERLQNKAIFNYWGKISLSGLLSNIGIRRDKKYNKLYREAMEKYHLPPDLLKDDLDD